MKKTNIVSGAVPSIYDSRDYVYDNVGKSSTPFDWNVGFDIEEKLGRKIKVKSQGSNFSCGGQAFSYYTQILELISSKTFEERSAKFLYSQVALPGGGSRGRDICKIIYNQGSAREAFCPSYYMDDTPLEESSMIDTSSINEIIRMDAKSAKALTYENIKNITIDNVASALRDNNGVVIGVSGDNNGTWLTEFPQPPKNADWGHWIYVGKAKMINGKKYIGVLNSWGDKIGNYGWQWIGEDYFNTIASGYIAIWEAWTIVLEQVDEKNNLLKTLLLALLKRFKK